MYSDEVTNLSHASSFVSGSVSSFSGTGSGLGFINSGCPVARLQADSTKSPLPSTEEADCESIIGSEQFSNIWDDQNSVLSRRKFSAEYERSFQISQQDFHLSTAKRSKAFRDAASHRIIEKRRRDRMNNCLSSLSRMIPESYVRKGRGRIEKTEIIEMATQYLRQLKRQSATTASNKALCMVDKAVLTDQKVEDPISENCPSNTEFYCRGFTDCFDALFWVLNSSPAFLSTATSELLRIELISKLSSMLQQNMAEMQDSTRQSTQQHAMAQLSTNRPINVNSLPYPDAPNPNLVTEPFYDPNLPLNMSIRQSLPNCGPSPQQNGGKLRGILESGIANRHYSSNWTQANVTPLNLSSVIKPCCLIDHVVLASIVTPE